MNPEDASPQVSETKAKASPSLGERASHIRTATADRIRSFLIKRRESKQPASETMMKVAQMELPPEETRKDPALQVDQGIGLSPEGEIPIGTKRDDPSLELNSVDPSQEGSDQKNADSSPGPESNLGSNERLERSRDMMLHLESYVIKLLESQVASRLAEHPTLQEATPRQDVARKLEKIKKYFSTVNKELGMSPVDRLSQVYESLDIPSNPDEAREMNEAIRDHSQEVIERAFDQHYENPEQYVSHGFDHSLNVTEYTKAIVEQNPQIVATMQEKYGLSAGQSQFMLENVAIFHDFGYPMLGSKDKAVHALAGADIASTDKIRSLFGRLVGKDLSYESKNILTHDFSDAILHHNADTVQKSFNGRLETTIGDFLIDKDNLSSVISSFENAHNPTGRPRESRIIYVNNPEMAMTFQQALEDASSSTQDKTGEKAGNIIIQVLDEKNQASFKGRVLDLENKKDGKLGLEFQEADALKSPLHAVIRMADNMDMRTNRFSEIQQHPAFQEIFTRFGDQGPDSQVLQNLEELSKTAKDLKRQLGLGGAQNQNESDRNKDLLETSVSELTRNLSAQEAQALQQQIQEIKTPAEAEKLWKTIVVDKVLRGFDLSREQTEQLKMLGLAQSSESMRHFGGCAAVKELQLVGSTLTITVDAAKYQELNDVRVAESSFDLNGDLDRVVVGVGEYQIWRLKQAYSSIRIGGEPVQINLKDTSGSYLDTQQSPQEDMDDSFR